MIRTEVARRLSGSPFNAWMFLRIHPGDLVAASAKLSILEEVRVMAATIGPFNAVMAVWMRRIEDVHGWRPYSTSGWRGPR